jgi:hypothetical protein
VRKLAYDLAWYTGRLRAILIVLIGVCWGMRKAAPARDVLVMLGQSGSAAAWGLFVSGIVWLGLNAWFWSRFALMRGSGAGTNIGHSRQRQRLLIRLWLPRVLGLVPFLGVPFAMLGASAEIPQGMRSMMGPEQSGAETLNRACVLIALLGLVLFRIVMAGRKWRLGRASGASGLRTSGMVLVAASVGAAAVGLSTYGLDPVQAGMIFQPGPTILFAAAALICGGTLITWFGARTRLPVLMILCAVAFVLAELRDADIIADNHDIRMLDRPLRARPDIATAFRAFLASSAARYKAPEPVPVILVASSSGGLAAAFWSATILGDLADQVPGFSDQLFAVSGVSGGALGALESVAMLSQPRPAAGCPGVRACTQRALGADFLGPTLGSLLYPDLMQRFVPVPLFQDRAAALEQAWETRWRQTAGDDRLAQPFLDLWPAGHPWPALLLNGTSVLTGERLITSNLQLAGADRDLSIDAIDLLRETGAEVRASTAVDSSARFPLFGPVGVVRARGGGAVAGLVVDGGYFEDFGATTLLETLDVLAEVARRDKAPVRFIVIQIIGAAAAPKETLSGSLLPRGLWGPLDTLLHTREARGAAATEALARQTAALGGVYAPLRLGFSPTGQTAPLSWSLSPVAQHVIDVQWTAACREELAGEMLLTMHDRPMPAMDFGQMMAPMGCTALGH